MPTRWHWWAPSVLFWPLVPKINSLLLSYHSAPPPPTPTPTPPIKTQLMSLAAAQALAAQVATARALTIYLKELISLFMLLLARLLLPPEATALIKPVYTKTSIISHLVTTVWAVVWLLLLHLPHRIVAPNSRDVNDSYVSLRITWLAVMRPTVPPILQWANSRPKT